VVFPYALHVRRPLAASTGNFVGLPAQDGKQIKIVNSLLNRGPTIRRNGLRLRDRIRWLPEVSLTAVLTTLLLAYRTNPAATPRPFINRTLTQVRNQSGDF